MKIGNLDTSKKTIIVAEIGANHQNKLDVALAMIYAAKEVGADMVKGQCFEPDDLCCNGDVVISDKLWQGKKLYDLYKEIAMPIEWHADLKAYADKLDIPYFATPFSPDKVDFLESIDVPCYKVASFEINHKELLERIKATKKPVIYSTGCCEDMMETSRIASLFGKRNSMALHCVSQYPAENKDANLMTIPALSQLLSSSVGISDHSKGIAIPIAAVAMGAMMVEKHFKLYNDTTSADIEFSLNPIEFKNMVQGIRQVEEGRLGVVYNHTSFYKRSLWVIKDIKQGEEFTKDNVKCLRPQGGLRPDLMEKVLSSRATVDIVKNVPLVKEYIG